MADAAPARQELSPTQPFGAPTVVSPALWGGAWVLPIWGPIRHSHALQFRRKAVVYGASGPSLVALAVVSPRNGG